MFTWNTAGESHGKSLIALVSGMVSGVSITTEDISFELARRRLGYGRGARMEFEADEVEILAGVRHGKTLAGPVAIEIKNSEWEKWKKVMSTAPIAASELDGVARNAALTRPRPGHADYSGLLKHDFHEIRLVLERASARETAARVAAGTLAKQFLAQVLDIKIISHVLSIGKTDIHTYSTLPLATELATIDASPVRARSKESEKLMIAEIDNAKKNGDTLGGVFEVIIYGTPVGIGDYAVAENRLDANLAAAFMSIPAIKGVEIGAGFQAASSYGSKLQDEIIKSAGRVSRTSNNAGGIEGGMANGEPIVIRAAMKPISTVPKALQTIDIISGATAKAIHQRSDICAVPAAAVVGEAMAALVITKSILAKFGGDGIKETQRNIRSYLNSIADSFPIYD